MSLSKQFKRKFSRARNVCAISLSISTIFFLAILPGSAQRVPDANATAARNAALVAATTEVLKETSDLRQLTILQPVQSSVQSRSEIESMIVKNLETELSAREIHGAEVTLKKLGLAPADFGYREFMIRLLTEQVAGYYDPKTRQFHLANWIDLDGQRPVMAHELTHALQDQHFNLRRFEHWPKGDSDAQLAAHSLVEGDATLLMSLYIANNPLRALAFLRSLSAAGMSSQELAKAPRALRETLLFPYQEGMLWTRALYRQGEWPRVSQAFSDLPQSTEQILHPDKYFAHEPPVKVTLPDISRWLPRPDGPQRLGWKKIDSDVQGEWGWYLILDQFLKSPAESRRAAAGWAGDRYETYEAPNGGGALFISTSAWDSEADAREFFDAFSKNIVMRYEGAIHEDPDPRNRSPEQHSMVWKTTDGTVAVNLRGKRVLIIEAPAEIKNVESLISALYR